jgi:hypothetical protein
MRLWARIVHPPPPGAVVRRRVMKIEIYVRPISEIKQVYAAYYSGEKIAEGAGPEFQAIRKLKKDRVVDDKDEVIVWFPKATGGWAISMTGSVKKMASLNVAMDSSGMGVNSHKLVGPDD